MSPSKTERVKSWLTQNGRNIINKFIAKKRHGFFLATRPDSGVNIFGAQ